MKRVEKVYLDYLTRLEYTIEEQKKPFFNKVDYNKFSDEQKAITENAVLLVGVLYEMCKVQLVEKTENETDLNKINEETANLQIERSEKLLEELKL